MPAPEPPVGPIEDKPPGPIPDAEQAAARHLGTLLVTLQILLMAGLAMIALPGLLHARAPAGAWVLLGLAAGLGLWALWCNRPGNFNVRPTPRSGGRLVQQGPYRWVRHPMYSAVLIASGACAWVGSQAAERAAVTTMPEGPWWVWLGWFVLLAVLCTKAWLEEHWMLAQHPDYAAYRSRTYRFVPGLF